MYPRRHVERLSREARRHQQQGSDIARDQEKQQEQQLRRRRRKPRVGGNAPLDDGDDDDECAAADEDSLSDHAAEASDSSDARLRQNNRPQLAAGRTVTPTAATAAATTIHLPRRSTSELGFQQQQQQQEPPTPPPQPPPRPLARSALLSQSESQVAAGFHQLSKKYKPHRRRAWRLLDSRSLSTSSIFAFYATKYALERFYLALRTFKTWYHEQLTYHHLSRRMEFNQQLFDRWYKRRGRPLGLRALDHFDQVVIWIADERDVIQKRTFTEWINKYLARRGKQMHDLYQDLRDGQNLISLLEMLSGQNLPRERGKTRVHQLQNIQIALNYIKLRKVKLVNIKPEDIVDGNQKITLALIWTIILHFQLEDNSNFGEVEANYRLKMDSMKRRLDELELRIDNMGPIARDLKTIQRQLDELRNFVDDLKRCGKDLNELCDLGEDLIKQGLIADPDTLRRDIKTLKDQYARIEEKADRRMKAFQDALKRAEAQQAAEKKFYLRLNEIKKALDELEFRIDNMGPIAKDLKGIQRQLDEMRVFEKDLRKVGRDLNELCEFGEDLIKQGLISDPVALRKDVQALKDQFARIEEKAAKRLRAIQDALKRAEDQQAAEQKFKLRLNEMKRRLDELEHRIDNMGPIARDLKGIQRQLDELRDFERDLRNCGKDLNELCNFGEDLIEQGLITDPITLRRDMQALKDQFARIEDKFAKRMRDMQDALKRAEAQQAAEQKFRLRLNEMKRALDELEFRIDNMGPIAKDLKGIQRQLDELRAFDKDLKKCGKELNELCNYGEDLIRQDLIADPITLRKDMQALKDQYARIEEKAAKRLRDLQDAMSRVAASDAIQNMANWLERARKMLIEEENVHGDLDTVSALIEQHKSFQDELAAHQPTMNEVRKMERELSNSSPQNGAIIRDELSSLSAQWREVEKLTREKSAKLEEALRVAEQMHGSVGGLLEWLADAEMKLRFAGTLPEDENATKQELAEHEKFMRKLATQGENKEKILSLAREILAKCHPDAEPVIKLNSNIIESRWDDIEAWAKQRGQRLSDHLRNLLDILELVEELSNWLARHEGRLLAEEAEALPENAHQLESMIDQHSAFMDELRKRELDVDRVVKIFAAKSSTSTSKMILTTTTTRPRDGATTRTPSSSGRSSGGTRSTTPTRTSYATYRDEYPEVKQARARVMLEKWRSVWQLSVDKMQRLKDRVEHSKELERLENFDFDEWRRRFITWVNAKKGRVMDFYRSIDDDNDGRIPIEAFINGVLRSRFESSRLEMERAAGIIDKNNDGTIDNKEYLDSLRPDKPITDDEIIQDEVQRQVAKCTCTQRFKVYHVGEGRYRFGESQLLRLVRILRSAVMVRVGGGWEPLISFLQKNDPCRAKGRTNVELREQFILPEGASQAMAAFRSKMSKDPGTGSTSSVHDRPNRDSPRLY